MARQRRQRQRRNKKPQRPGASYRHGLKDAIAKCLPSQFFFALASGRRIEMVAAAAGLDCVVHYLEGGVEVAGTFSRKDARYYRRLERDMGEAVKDDYVRSGSKKARNWPRKKREKPLGVPKNPIGERQATGASGETIKRKTNNAVVDGVAWHSAATRSPPSLPFAISRHLLYR